MPLTGTRPQGLEVKAASASPESGLIAADDATGVVEAIVSVTGVKDDVDDVILPGAYAETLTKRIPKGIFVHDWSKWVARTEQVEELMPGDARLPKSTKDGQPWPQEAGGLYVRARFNLGTREGKDAYSNVKFFSETGECDWSIGFRVPKGGAIRTKDGLRRIERLDLFEYSPVLFGAAGSFSGTLSVKDAQPGAEDDVPEEAAEDAPEGAPADDPEDAPADPGEAEDGEDGDGEDDEDALHAAALPHLAEEVPEDVDDFDPEDDEDDEEGSDPETPDGDVEPGQGDDPGDTEEHDADAEEKRTPRARLDVKDGVPGVSDTPKDEAAVRKLKNWYTRGGGAAKIRWGTKGDFMRCVRIAEKHMDPQRARGFCQLRHKEALGVYAGQERGGRKTAPEADAAGEVYPFLEGTFEEVRDLIVAEASKTLGGFIDVIGTWPDHAVIARYPSGGGVETLDVPFEIGAEGKVVLGDAEAVALTIEGEDGFEEPGENLLPYPAAIDTVTDAVKTLLHTETKAGRVLSGANVTRLKSAVEHLVAVLKAAGVDIDEPEDPIERDEPARDSSAPSAQVTIPEGKMLIDPILLARTYRLVADVTA